MADSTLDPLEYYAQPGLMTDPKEHASLFKGLPADWQPLTLAQIGQSTQG